METFHEHRRTLRKEVERLKGTDKGVEISFDQKQTAGIKEGDNKLTVTFVGPKPKGPAKPAAGGGAMPGGPAAVGVPGAMPGAMPGGPGGAP